MEEFNKIKEDTDKLKALVEAEDVQKDLEEDLKVIAKTQEELEHDRTHSRCCDALITKDGAFCSRCGEHN